MRDALTRKPQIVFVADGDEITIDDLMKTFAVDIDAGFVFAPILVYDDFSEI